MIMSKGSPWIRWEGGLLVKLSSLLSLVNLVNLVLFPGNRNNQMIISKIRDIDAGVSAFKQKAPENKKTTVTR